MKHPNGLGANGVEVTTSLEAVPWGVHPNIADLYGNPYNPVENR